MFTFRPLNENDFELLTQWRNQPHIDTWWDGATDFEGIRVRYGPRINVDSIQKLFIVEYDSKPFGRLQYEPTCTWLPDFPPNVANVDYLIGMESDIGKGLGPQMIDQFVTEVIAEDGRFETVISDPDVKNIRSVRALEKAGFTKFEIRAIDGRTFQFLKRKLQ